MSLQTLCLSILYLRCIAAPIELLSEFSPVSFNSLFEMRREERPTPLPLVYQLSILYLRCAGGKGLLQVVAKGPFNSLFEMQVSRGPEHNADDK